MPVRVAALPRDPALYQRVVDIPLTAEERRRVRRRLAAPDGEEVWLELPTGTILRPGQILAVVEGTAYRVVAAEEDVLLVFPLSPGQGVGIGHLIGNLHRDVVVEGDVAIVLWDPPLADRLRRLGVRVERARRPFGGDVPAPHGH